MKDLTLHHASIVEPSVLDDVPVDVCLSVLLPANRPQKHDGFININRKPSSNIDHVFTYILRMKFMNSTLIHSMPYQIRKATISSYPTAESGEDGLGAD